MVAFSPDLLRPACGESGMVRAPMVSPLSLCPAGEIARDAAGLRFAKAYGVGRFSGAPGDVGQTPGIH